MAGPSAPISEPLRVRLRGASGPTRTELAGQLAASGMHVVADEADAAQLTVCWVPHSASDLPDFVGEPTLALVPRGSPLNNAIAAGARGALFDDANRSQLVAAALAIASGLRVMDEQVRSPSPLSSRETAVLTCLAIGLPNKLVADRLGVSPNTVKFHTQHIFQKLGARSRVEALAIATRGGWLPSAA